MIPEAQIQELKAICESNHIDFERLLCSLHGAADVYRPAQREDGTGWAIVFLQHIYFSYSNPIYSEFSLTELAPVTTFLKEQVDSAGLLELSDSQVVDVHDGLKEMLFSFKSHNQWVERLNLAQEAWLVLGNMTLRALRRPLLIIRRNKDRNRKRMRYLLENAASNGVWSTIERGSPVHNRFLFRLPYQRELRGDTLIVDLAFFVIQIGDEFLDGLVSILRLNNELHLLTDKLKEDRSLLYFKWNEGNKEKGIVLSKGLLDIGGRWIDEVNEKYELSYREIYARIQLILDDLNDILSGLDRRNEIGDCILEFFNFCIQSGLDDILLMKSASGKPVNLNSIRWQFHKKSDLAMSYWIGLRAKVLNLPFAASSNRYAWGSLLHCCQIFDDLKDVKVDYNQQANLVLTLAYHFHRKEFEWFKNELDDISEIPDMDLICKLMLNMPLTVLHSYTYTRCKGVIELDWLTMKGANGGWFRNWTGRGKGCYIPNARDGFELSPRLSSSLTVFNSPISDLIVNAMIDLEELFQTNIPIEDKLAYLFDVLYYDDGFFEMLKSTLTFKERYLLRMNGFFISSSFKARLLSQVVMRSYGEYSEVEKALRKVDKGFLLGAFEHSYQMMSPVINR